MLAAFEFEEIENLSEGDDELTVGRRRGRQQVDGKLCGVGRRLMRI